MRTWLYDRLANAPSLQGYYSDPDLNLIVFPRESMESSAVVKPYLVYGLGTESAEDLAEDNDHTAERQFFQVWVHDEGGDYGRIDEIVGKLKVLLTNASSPADNVIIVRYLETSQEFSHQTLKTLFRYVRFQAIIGKGATL